MNILETERLILRQFTPQDAATNYRIYTDPENMKFMGRQPDSVEFERDQTRKTRRNLMKKRRRRLESSLRSNHILCGGESGGR